MKGPPYPVARPKRSKAYPEPDPKDDGRRVSDFFGPPGDPHKRRKLLPGEVANNAASPSSSSTGEGQHVNPEAKSEGVDPKPDDPATSSGTKSPETKNVVVNLSATINL